MRLGTRGGSLALSLVLMSGAAFGMSLSAALKNYYAQFEIVLDCEEQAQLTTAEVDAAEVAINKIETYYLNKDSSIDKEHLLKQAVSDKNEGFRIMARSGGGLRPYCQTSLSELLAKAKEIGPSGQE